MTASTDRIRRPGITRDRVTDAALARIDADGLPALTMRRLARDLGIDAMSLYNHVRDKADLLDAVQVRLLAGLGIERGEPGANEAYLLGVGRAYRRVSLAHPRAMPVVFTRPITTPEALRPVEAILETLAAAGIDATTALTAVSTLFGFLNGYLLAETSNRPDLAGDGPGVRPPADAAAAYRALDDAEFGRLRAMGGAMAGLDPDTMFETSLGIVVGGIMAFLAARDTAASRPGRLPS